MTYYLYEVFPDRRMSALRDRFGCHLAFANHDVAIARACHEASFRENAIAVSTESNLDGSHEPWNVGLAAGLSIQTLQAQYRESGFLLDEADAIRELSELRARRLDVGQVSFFRAVEGGPSSVSTLFPVH